MKRKRSHSHLSSRSSSTYSSSDGDDVGDRSLYVVLTYILGKYSHTFHRIRLSDLISSSRRHGNGSPKLKMLPKPFVKLTHERYPAMDGFLAFGSKIYMFGSSSYSVGGKLELSLRFVVLDTCKNNPGVKEGPPMNLGKSFPFVLGPLDGKFYVLSSTLAARDLEEFDPQTETWTLLPKPPITDEELEDARNVSIPNSRFKQRDGYEVISYAIVKKRILLSTYKGNYAFDSISRELEVLSCGVNEFPFVDGAQFLDGIWYALPCVYLGPTLIGAYSFDENRLFQGCRVHGLRPQSWHVKRENRSILAPMGGRMLCIVHAGFHCADFYVCVDMCKFSKCRVKSSGKPKHPKASSRYSARYIMDDPLEEEPYLAAAIVI